MIVTEKKKITHNIERYKVDGFRCLYNYKFGTNQWLESVDDMSEMSSYSHNGLKQLVIDHLVDEFRISLNNAIFGDPAKGNLPSQYKLIKT